MADPIIAALPARAALAIGLPAVAEMLVARPQVPVLIMPSGTVAMLPVRYGVQVTAAGGFAATGYAVYSATVEFAGVGAISAAALQVQARGVQFAGEGTFTASDTPRRFVEFAAAGGFAATGYAVYSATVEFAGVGAISAAALQVQARGVQFSGVGTLSATGVQVQTRGVQFAGDVTLAAASTWQGAPQRVGTPVMASSTTHQVAINYPDASAPGDLILLLAQYGRTTGTSANDWSATGPAWGVVSTQNMESSSLFATVLWAIRGEETSVTVSVSPTANPRAVEVYAVAYDGATVHLTAPIGPVSSNGAVASTAITSTALSSVDADSELLGLYWGWRSGSTTAWSTTWSGGSFTKRDEQQIGLSTYRVLSSMGTMVQATAGTSPAVTVTRSSSVAARGLTVVAIRPAKST